MVPDDPLRESILLLARWLQETTAVDNLGGGLDILLEEKLLPDDVRAALESLRSVTLKDLVGPEAAPSISDAIDAVEIALADQRTSTIFWDRISSSPPTLDEIGGRLNVTRERVRQIQVGAEDAVRAALESRSCTALRWRIFRLAQRLGRAAPASAEWVGEAIDEALVGIPAPWQLRLRALALWSAGPYRRA